VHPTVVATLEELGTQTGLGPLPLAH
jgi:hypothetical protein